MSNEPIYVPGVATMMVYEAHANELITERDALRADRDRLYYALGKATEALNVYGTHDHGPTRPCDCGLSDAVEAARKALKDGR